MQLILRLITSYPIVAMLNYCIIKQENFVMFLIVTIFVLTALVCVSDRLTQAQQLQQLLILCFLLPEMAIFLYGICIIKRRAADIRCCQDLHRSPVYLLLIISTIIPVSMPSELR